MYEELNNLYYHYGDNIEKYHVEKSYRKNTHKKYKK